MAEKVLIHSVGEVDADMAALLESMSGNAQIKRAFLKRCEVLGREKAEEEYSKWMIAALRI